MLIPLLKDVNKIGGVLNLTTLPLLTKDASHFPGFPSITYGALHLIKDVNKKKWST